MSNRAAWLSALLLAALASAIAAATTVMPMSMPVLADHAACVMTGEVSAIRAYWTGQPRTIESRVTFENVTFLKGAPADPDETTFALTVPGGRRDGFELRLAGAPSFAVGQRWLLFVLPAWRTHPVVGVRLGAFEIAEGADGVARVHQGGRPVTGIDAEGLVQVARDPAAGAITLEQFQTLLAPVLAASRTHELEGPPGQRLAVTLEPVPLRRAGTEASDKGAGR